MFFQSNFLFKIAVILDQFSVVISITVWDGTFNRFTYKCCSPNIPEIHKTLLFSVKGLLYSILFWSVHSLHTLGTEFCLAKVGEGFTSRAARSGHCCPQSLICYWVSDSQKVKKALCKGRKKPFSWAAAPANISYGPHTRGCHQKPLFSFLCQYFSTYLHYCFLWQMCLCCVLLVRSFTAEEWVLKVHCPCKLKTGEFRLKT